MKGERGKQVLDLFEECSKASPSERRELRAKLVAQVIEALEREQLSLVIEELAEAWTRYPSAFADVMENVCRQIDVERSDNLSAFGVLLDLYRRLEEIRSGNSSRPSLRSFEAGLVSVRNRALRAPGVWPIVEVNNMLTTRGLDRRFMELVREIA